MDHPALENELLSSTESAVFMGRQLPLHNFLVSIITWAQLMLPKLADDIPKRIKKSAPAAVKQGVCVVLPLTDTQHV